MTTWEATAQVLSKSSQAFFGKTFARFMKDDMMLPATVYKTNSAPFQCKDKVNLASEFSKGKDTMNKSMRVLRNTLAEEIGEVRKEMRMGNKMLQAQMSVNTKSISVLTVMRTEFSYTRKMTIFTFLCILALSTAYSQTDYASAQGYTSTTLAPSNVTLPHNWSLFL